MTSVAGILLAAGESRRMGRANKLLLRVDGEPLVRHSARTLLASRLRELVVVLGHERESVKRALADLDVRTIDNAAYREGQMTSVHCGLAALTGSGNDVMICLADQPLLTTRDVDALIDAFARRTRGSILVPTHVGRRGNPIVIAAAHRDVILRGDRNLGCKRLIERYPDEVVTLPMADDHTVCDLDRPEDYERLRERIETATIPG